MEVPESTSVSITDMAVLENDFQLICSLLLQIKTRDMVVVEALGRFSCLRLPYVYVPLLHGVSQ
jgi:hypothetical protein